MMVVSSPHLLLTPVAMAWDYGGEDVNIYVHKIGKDQLLGVIFILCFSSFLVVWWEERLHTGPIGKKTFEFTWVEK